ncbi:hypothetical protein ACJX0J_021152, partial [Zea mays]
TVIRWIKVDQSILMDKSILGVSIFSFSKHYAPLLHTFIMDYNHLTAELLLKKSYDWVGSCTTGSRIYSHMEEIIFPL